MISLIKETNSTIYRVIISIESVDCYGKKVMDKCSFLFNKKLSLIIKENIKALELNRNKKILLERMLVDLGSIDINAFETELPIKLKSELRKNIQKYFHSCEYNLWEEKKSYPLSMHKPVNKYIDRSENNISYQISTETLLIEKVDHYLRKGNWLFDDRKHHIPNIVHIDNQLWQQINHQPQQWLPMLAKHCLQPVRLSRLIQICQPEVLSMLCQLFTKTTSEFVNSQVQVIIDKKVTPEKLSLAAEYYLQHQMTYVNTAQQARTELQVQNDLTSVNNTTENGNNSLKPDIGEVNTLINDAEQPFSQQPLQPIQTHHQIDPIQSRYGLIKEVGERRHIQPDSAIPTPSSQSVLPISNAGFMILWPLLPTFFRTFDLLEKNQFISLKAQRKAVCLLDWLIWEEEEIPTWRLTLNKVICGLPINDSSLWRTPEPEQQIAINQWLEKIIEQLPAWKKMGVNDVRHLFLQRCGELSELNGITNIHIKPEVYDALISEWPWPINIASFSWLQHPITITWL